MKNDFYVYQYVRRDGSPYYIGKGCGRRAYQSHKDSACNKPNTNSRIIILHENLDEGLAFILEKLYITEIGRKDLGMGPLRNRTDGGEGTSGSICSPETKIRMSLALRGKKKSPEHIEKVRLANNLAASTLYIFHKGWGSITGHPY